MRFNDLLHLIAFPWKAHGTPPAPGFVIAAKMPESPALSKFSDHFSPYIPLSAPPALDEAQQEELKGAVREPPATELANWYWKEVRQLVFERFGVELSHSSCLNWLHRLGFSFKRPRKRLVKVLGQGQ